MAERSLFRRLMCLVRACPFRQGSDETGCWGECEICHMRVGFVSRDDLRAYADREVDEMRLGEEAGRLAVDPGPSPNPQLTGDTLAEVEAWLTEFVEVVRRRQARGAVFESPEHRLLFDLIRSVHVLARSLENRQ